MEFYLTSGLVYSEAIKFGIECWITHKCGEACGRQSNVEGIIRDNLSYALAKLKFGGKVPTPIEMKLASLFDIKGWEIDENAEFFQYDRQVLNGTIPPEGSAGLEKLPAGSSSEKHTAEVVEFPADRIRRQGCSEEGGQTDVSAANNVIAFPAHRIVRRRRGKIKAA
jgi:hypothetical protein